MCMLLLEKACWRDRCLVWMWCVDERSLRWGQAAQYRGGDSTATMRRSTNGASNQHGRQLFLRLDDPTRCLDSAASATLLHAGHEEIRLGA